ncbi:hypothetical protein [Allokutzneria albata]|uniref:Excreted virulence factor EspC, type VII ESX diderm n=1 Tax=Allokutzneria albata TaxID=211114 RepID=A0A1H0DL19_ALLAB|nr:hypothetical protein [Allokutzneria albata]SDN70701.1 hypothetical protein SAMN04489726_7863 [Allokutzneria albata]
MTDYRVVPAALRKSVKEIHEAADAWTESRKVLDGLDMRGEYVGELARYEELPQAHNEALGVVVAQLRKGFEALENAALTLKKVADDYESRDAEYYRKFGYIDERIGR